MIANAFVPIFVYFSPIFVMAFTNSVYQIVFWGKCNDAT